MSISDAERIGNPTELMVAEAVWAVIHLDEADTTWDNVVENVRWINAENCELMVEEAEDLIRQASNCGDVTVTLNDAMQWCVGISEHTEARITQRHAYWFPRVDLEMELGRELSPILHWDQENEIARRAVVSWMAVHGVAPVWYDLNDTMAAEVGDPDIANQMAFNAAFCGAIVGIPSPDGLRFVLGDFTPMQWPTGD